MKVKEATFTVWGRHGCTVTNLGMLERIDWHIKPTKHVFFNHILSRLNTTIMLLGILVFIVYGLDVIAAITGKRK